MMAFLLVISTLVVTPQASATQIEGEDPGVSDVPSWQIGDKWIHAGSFDPTLLVQNAGVQAAVGKINGDATTIVQSITERTVDNVSTLVYLTSSTANFDKGGVTLDGYTGNLYIEYQVDEVVRVSDLATISSDLSLNVRYVPYGISSLTQQIADITIGTGYDPASETYDFPLRMGETWNTSYVSSSAWSGSSDYITPFPAPTSGANHTNWEVTNIGKPKNDIGEQISYDGCNASYELTSFDDNGTETAYKWFCPEVRYFAWSHTEEDIGLVIDFRLKQYLPVDSSGVIANSQPGYRNNLLTVESSSTITALDSPLEVWANLTDSLGNPVNGADIEIRYEPESFTSTLTTNSNGSVWTIIDVGSKRDTSTTTFDWSSHGIIARHGNLIGVSTITLDESIVGLDLVSGLERASVLRNRSGELFNLNLISGFNVLPGDNLIIDLPIYNRGITTSLPAEVEITKPDGTSFRESLPALALYEQHVVSFEWSIPSDSPIDNLSIIWEADPSETNSNDADSSNDLATIPLFVGRLPTFIAENQSVLTNEIVHLNASGSYDSDGGEIWCEFKIPYDDGTRTLAWQRTTRQNCMMNWTWTDDGIYNVEVTIHDDEADSIVEFIEVEIINRAPNVRIVSLREEVKVEHLVTLQVFANDSDSEDSWPGMVDVHWPTTDCQEGYYTRTCTTTAWTEGLHTFTAVGTDDDGVQSVASIDIVFTNIAPHDVSLSMWDKNGELIKADSQMTWHIDEDQEIEISARAEDSMDDLENLHYQWSFGAQTDGRESRVSAQWSESGLHKILVEATDSEGETSGLVERWIDVRNVPPVVEPLPEILPLAEGQSISLIASATDTYSDVNGLQTCWDMNPGIDTDGIGSADDDCDIIGLNMTWSWAFAGEHNFVFHATDDDGVRVSSTATVTVLNLPPIVRIKPISDAEVGEIITLDASPTLDSPADRETLTVVWDVDCSRDSDGDGIKDNDADIVGNVVQYSFSKQGKWKIKAIAWDENVFNPGSSSTTVTVDAPDMTAFEEVIESLSGDDSNPILQLLVLGTIIILLAMFMRRNPKQKDSVWDEESVEVRRPMSAPEIKYFENDVFSTEDTEAPPLPEEGLPEGWTGEQWEHYGHQYLSSLNQDNEQDEK
jgi:hypothetical protein